MASPTILSKTFLFDSRGRRPTEPSAAFRVLFRDLAIPFRHVQRFDIRSVVVSSGAVPIDSTYLLLRIPELDGFEHPLLSNIDAGNRAFCSLFPEKRFGGDMGGVTRFDVISPAHEKGVASITLPSLPILTFELIDPTTNQLLSFTDTQSWAITGVMYYQQQSSHGWESPFVSTDQSQGSRPV